MKKEQVEKWLDFAWEDIRIIDDLIKEEAFGLVVFIANKASKSL